MPSVRTIYEFSEVDVRRGMMLRFEELYGQMGVTPDDFRFSIDDSVDGYPHDGFVPARIRSVTVEI